ncbi:unnamed protein product [Prunus armeniaca]
MALALNTPTINFSQIETLTGSNFKLWKFDLEVTLGMSDIDYAVTQGEPTRPVANSPVEVKRCRAVYGISERKFKEFGKAKTNNLMSRLANTKYEEGRMKSSVNTLKEDWTMDDLITIVVLEENRTQTYGGVVNVVTARKYENKGAVKSGLKKQSQSQKNNSLGMTPTTEFKCYFIYY